jgi:hypothetical protein
MFGSKTPNSYLSGGFMSACGCSQYAESLCLALEARLVINTLLGFNDGNELHPHTADGIAKIAEVRSWLLYFDKRLEGRPSNSDMTYDQLTLIRETVKALDWTTWDSDLQQWLANKESVKRFFVSLESRVLAGARRLR